MSPETKRLLEQFAAHANWGTVGHPSDMERFWDFVISAYRNGEHNISLDEFLDVVGHTKNEESVQKKKRDLASKMFLFGKYEDGIKLLRNFEGK